MYVFDKDFRRGEYKPPMQRNERNDYYSNSILLSSSLKIIQSD